MQAVRELIELENSFALFNSSTSTPEYIGRFGNDTRDILFEPLNRLTSDYSTAWGKDSCRARVNVDFSKFLLYSSGINTGIGVENPSTDIEVRNGIAYLTADSPTSSAHDFFIIDMRDPRVPSILSSITTGPGLSALDIAGPYVYTANIGTTNQLQIIDIHNRSTPIILSRYRLPLPRASSTAPFASAIFYDKGLIYLGTEKWEGHEFNIIDVANPASPQYLGSFETNTLVKNIYVRDGLAYVAGSDINQMRILDVQNPSSISLVANFSPSGWETQEGNIISFFEEQFSLGRTTGGFNNISNHELFIFSTTSMPTVRFSRDIPGGVYGIVHRPPYIYLATHFLNKEFQVRDENMSIIFEKTLGFSPSAMSCDAQDFYFATGDNRGVAVMRQSP